MKGFVFESPRVGSIRELKKKKPADDQVLIKVRYCGICGTDMNIWRGTDHAEKGIVLGHEYCGTIVEVGKKVKNFKIGDRAGVDPNISCGQCEFCRDGRVNLCDNLKALGVDIDGGFEEYSCVPEKQLFALPDELSFEVAVLMEPIACAINGIERANIRIGNDVLILGGGPMGLLMIQLAHLKGSGRVVLCEKRTGRRTMGKEAGADIVIDDIDQYHNVCEFNPDRVIECIGNPYTQEKGFEIVKKGGEVLLFGDGNFNSTFKVPSSLFYSKELVVKGAALNPFTHEAAARIISSNKLKLDKMVSGMISIDELPRILDNGFGEEDIKVVVAFD